MKSAIELIADERRRQIEGEGWTHEHVDGFKPTPDDRIRELVKAGALIVAEIERLQRQQLEDETQVYACERCHAIHPEECICSEEDDDED